MFTDKLIKYNYVKSRGGNKIEYIVVHDTANKRFGADAESHFIYFNGANRNASAHYFVDSEQILRLVKDEDTAWHCGDAGVGTMKHKVKNSNSIGIEICINSDGDYNRAVAKTQSLIVMLMGKHKIPLDNVIRHYDVTKKNCPGTMSANNWQAWRAFILTLESLYKQSDNLVWVEYMGRRIGVPGVLEEGKNYVAIRELLEAMGYEVGWDNIKKVVLIK